MQTTRGRLTEREQQIIGLIARGKSNTEIAAELGMSFTTAKTHVSNILAKLEVGTREEAARWWDEHGTASRPSVFARWVRSAWGAPALSAGRILAGVAGLIAAAVMGLLVFLVFASWDGGNDGATPPASETCPVSDGISLEPFCVAWEPPEDPPDVYTIWLAYRPGTSNAEYENRQVDGSATSFTFPDAVAPPRNVPFEECAGVDSVAIRVFPFDMGQTDRIDAIFNRTFRLACANFNDDGTVSAVLAPPDLGIDEQLLGLFIRPVTEGDAVEMPDVSLLVAHSGCCEGPLSSLARYERAQDGSVVETVLTGAPHTAAGSLTGYAISPDARELAVGICTAGYCGPLNAIGEDARSSIYRSSDGGATWTEAASFDFAAHPWGFADGGIAYSDWGTELAPKEEHFVLLPDGTSVPGPPPAANQFDLGIDRSGDEPLTRSANGKALTGPDGRARYPLPRSSGDWSVPVISDDGRRTLIVTSDDERRPERLVTVYNGTRPDGVFDISGATGYTFLAWVDFTHILTQRRDWDTPGGVVDRLGVFDARAGTWHPIAVAPELRSLGLLHVLHVSDAAQ